MEKGELRICCNDLHNVLTDGDLKYIDDYELHEELLIFCTMIFLVYLKSFYFIYISI